MAKRHGNHAQLHDRTHDNTCFVAYNSSLRLLLPRFLVVYIIIYDNIAVTRYRCILIEPTTTLDWLCDYVSLCESKDGVLLLVIEPNS